MRCPKFVSANTFCTREEGDGHSGSHTFKSPLELEGEIADLQRQLADANKEVGDGFDAIFPYVPQAKGDNGKELSLAEKIEILAADAMARKGELIERAAQAAKFLSDREEVSVAEADALDITHSMKWHEGRSKIAQEIAAAIEALDPASSSAWNERLRALVEMAMRMQRFECAKAGYVFQPRIPTFDEVTAALSATEDRHGTSEGER